MTNIQNLKYKMYAAVLEVLNGNPAILALVPKLAELLPKLIAQVGTVDAGTEIDNETTAGTTKAKSILRDRLAQNCFRLANAVSIKAEENNDEDLLAKIPTSMSTFEYGRDAELLGLYKFILKAAKPLDKDLGAFTIEASVLTQVEADIAEFKANLNSPKVKRDDTTLKRAAWAIDFKKTDKLLLAIDRTVNTLIGKPDMEAFCQAYKKARVAGISNSKKAKPSDPELQPKASPAPPNLNTGQLSQLEIAENGSLA